ncbi:hypothetical protein V6767_07750 [Martelella sp. FLE1502]
MIDVTKHTSYAKLKDGVTGASRKNTARRVNFSLRPERTIRDWRVSRRPEQAETPLAIGVLRREKNLRGGMRAWSSNTGFGLLGIGSLDLYVCVTGFKERLEPKIGENAATSDKARKYGRLEDGAVAADFLAKTCGTPRNTVKVAFSMTPGQPDFLRERGDRFGRGAGVSGFL